MAIRGALACLVVELVFLQMIGASAGASHLPRSPYAAPQLECLFLPNPGSEASFPCDDPAKPPAIVNVSFRLRLTVTDADGDLPNVTIHFDFLDFLNRSGGPPGSLNQTLNITPGSTEPVLLETNWTYTQLGEVINPPNGSHYWVYVQGIDATGGTIDHFFEVLANVNSPPFVTAGPSNPYTVSPAIDFPDPVVPTARFNIGVQDPDDDPLTVTWEWGDGTSSVNVTPPAAQEVRVVATHDYPAALLRLNETPRTARVPLTIHVDDGQGHRHSEGPIAVQFVLNRDAPPSPSSFRSPGVGSLWKVGDLIPMEGFALDPDGDLIDPLMDYFWDIDNRTDADNDGRPDADVDYVGNVTAHEYARPDTYTISLWATDGEGKKECGDVSADDCVNPRPHYTQSRTIVTVRPNRPPVVVLANQNGSIEDGANLQATVQDPDGDNLTLTWDFGDGTNGTSIVDGQRLPGGPIVEPYLDAMSAISHAYPLSGVFYQVTVQATDGEATVEATARVFISEANLPPSPPLLRFLRANESEASNGTYLPNETARLEIVTFDPENDTLEVRIAWGDGRTTFLNVSRPEGNVTRWDIPGVTGASCRLGEQNQTVCLVNHTYARVGNFTVVVNLTDHRRYVILNGTTFEPEDLISHSLEGSATVFVRVPPVVEVEGPWDWWDYSTFAAVVGLPLLLVSRGLVRSYRERREE